MVARSYTRPLRMAVVLRAPVTTYAFRQAVRSLCATWGGARSLVISGTRAEPIADQWLPLLKAFDPDAVFLARPLGGARLRESVRAYLGRLGLAPFWVAELNDSLRLASGWSPQSLGGIRGDTPEGDEGSVASAANISQPNPIEAAVLGLHPRNSEPATPFYVARRDRYLLTHPASISQGTPLSAAAQDVPGFRSRSIPSAPFLYHERDDIDAALWLWNMRAIRGAVFHGNEQLLLDHLVAARSIRGTRPIPRQILCLDPFPASAQAIVDASGGSVAKAVEPTRYAWLPFLRPFLGGFDVELDELTVTDGRFQLARRAAQTAGVSGANELVQGDGAYAVEVDLEPSDASGLRLSLPSRPGLGNMLLVQPQSTLRAPLARLGVQSRVRQRGDSALAILPVRWPRSVSMAVPKMSAVLNGTAPTYRFELSDKGHFGRWLVGRTQGLSGLHELLHNSRSKAIIQAFREHHLPSQKPSGAYRRFLTLAEMLDQLAAERRADRLSRRTRGSLSDTEWLEAWIDRQVSAGVLRAGIWTRCDQCLAGSFLALGGFSDMFTCPRCGAIAQTPAVPRLGYQLAEVAHLFFANDCDISALALSALSRRSQGGFSFDFDHNITGPKGQRNELDFFAVIDGGLFVGESKKNGEFDRNDMDVLKRVARACQARAVVLATGTECDGGCSEKCERDIRQAFGTSDTALSSGAPGDGQRERALKLRADLEPNCNVVVLCRGELGGAFRVRPARDDVLI